MTRHCLAAEGISITFHERRVLDEVDITIRTGEIVGVTGPSGCGKTSLLRVLAGLLRPNAGAVRYDDAVVPRPASIALLAQHPRLVCNPRWTLERIIGEPARIRGEDITVSDVTSRVGLSSALLQRYPSQVSDGQLQRACIARVLVQRPSFVLCDEPTAMLDPIAAGDIVNLLRRIADDYAGVALVSHSAPVISALTESVITLPSRP